MCLPYACVYGYMHTCVKMKPEVNDAGVFLHLSSFYLLRQRPMLSAGSTGRLVWGAGDPGSHLLAS